MVTEIMIYPSYFDQHSILLDQLENRMTAESLMHYASLLLQKGLPDESILEKALEKAMLTCRLAELPPARHFRAIFISENGKIKKDWLVSDLGLQLILLSADVSDPSVAKLQIKILSNGYGRWMHTLQ